MDIIASFIVTSIVLHLMQKKGYSMYPGLRQTSISHTHVILAIQC